MTRSPMADPEQCEGLFGTSRAMRRLRTELQNVAPSDAPVLIWGEPGVGKERAARALHALSPRRVRPFVVVRCVGLEADALRRALSGSREPFAPRPSESAAQDPEVPIGALRQARGGTLLLDDVESLDAAAQATLLHLVHSLRPAQGPQRRRLPPPRLVLNSVEDLASLVRRGRFRRDLYHRLAVVRLHMPPLRARRDDLPALATEFLTERAPATGLSPQLTPEAFELLRAYSWPGNVRELKAVLTQASFRMQHGLLGIEDLSDLVERTASGATLEIPLGTSLQVAEQALIRATLAAFGGNKKRTATALGICRRTLYLKLAHLESV